MFQTVASHNTIDTTAYSPQVQLPVPIFAAEASQNSVPCPNHPWSSLPVPTPGASGDNDVSSPWQMSLGSVYYDAQARRYYHRCNICSTGISRLQDLKRHVNHKHGNEFIACEYPGCEELFPKARPDYLGKHVARYHRPREVQQQ
jgi:uncharacterized C2H2 Zn-finger protein